MERKQKIRLAAVMPLVLAAIAAPMVMASCDAVSNVTGSICCSDFKPGTNMVSVDWGLDGSANVEFGASLQAIGDFSATATGMINDLGVACKGLALDLGATSTQVTADDAKDPNKFATSWCTIAANLVGDLKGKAQLSIDIQPPSCHANFSAKADCEGSCNAQADCTIDPGYITANCTGGEVSGQCSGTCNGHCEGSANLAVTCSGQCSGTCEGMCDATTSTGQCAGKCSGKCRGDCTADGSASATCEGTCGGSCSVAFVAPSCSVNIKNPKAECNASASCEGSCTASASAKAECSPPSIDISFSGDFSTQVGALKKWLPQIYLVVEGKLKLLSGQIDGLVSVSGDLKAGLKADSKAIFCIVPAIAAVATAGDNIAASVSAGVSITGKIGN